MGKYFSTRVKIIYPECATLTKSPLPDPEYSPLPPPVESLNPSDVSFKNISLSLLKLDSDDVMVNDELLNVSFVVKTSSQTM